MSTPRVHPIRLYYSCTRKQRFRKRKSAENFFKKLRKRGIIVPSNAVIYECSHCGGFHVGHQKDKK